MIVSKIQNLCQIQQLMQNKINRGVTIDCFISKAKKNGYFNEIKQAASRNLPNVNRSDAQYRARARSYYGNKLKVPFKLLNQPEYKQELNYFSNFNAFVDSIPFFENIQEEEPKQIMNLETKVQKEAFSSTLLYDPAEKTPLNYAKNQLGKNNSAQLTFPTKIQFRTQLKKQRSNAFSNITLLSPTKTTRKTLKNRTGRTTSKNGQKGFVKQINEEKVLENLNKLLRTQHKKKNFRISKNRFHELLQNRYNHEIISTFFGIQTLEDFEGIVKLCIQIATCPEKLSHLLTFLTFDSNRDGIISEDELFALASRLKGDNPINQDVNKITAYLRKHPLGEVEPDLPLAFIRSPTYREYRRISNTYETKTSVKKTGVYRLFSMKEGEDETDERILPALNTRQQESLKKKQIQINFETFQKIFDHTKPNFIMQVCTFLLGQNIHISPIRQIKQEETTETKKNKKHKGSTQQDQHQGYFTKKHRTISNRTIDFDK